MIANKTFVSLALMAVHCCSLVLAGHISDYGSGHYSAGQVGTYAGQLIGSKALSELQSAASEEKNDYSVEAEEEGSHSHESLGELGDHLNDHHFPADYGHEKFDASNSEEYADATEHHESIEPFEKHEYEHEAVHPDISHSVDEDFHSKPVRGIDHGKGAFSYSTLYEHEDEKDHHEAY